MKRAFTGRDMFTVLFVGFGIVVAVNFTMAGYARSRFNGVVVENSYVASQKFNGWLDEARRAKALGWTATPERGRDGRLVVETAGVPDGASVHAELRRPLGDPQPLELELAPVGAARFAAADALPQGRWIVRLTIVSGADRWASEGEIG